MITEEVICFWMFWFILGTVAESIIYISKLDLKLDNIFSEKDYSIAWFAGPIYLVLVICLLIRVLRK